LCPARKEGRGKKKSETKRKGLRFSVARDEMNDRSFFFF